MAAPKPFGVALQLVCCIVTTHDATEYRRYFGWVAQSAEQWTENPRVGGSIPPPAISKPLERYRRTFAAPRVAALPILF